MNLGVIGLVSIIVLGLCAFFCEVRKSSKQSNKSRTDAEFERWHDEAVEARKPQD